MINSEKKILLWGGGSQARIIEAMIHEQELGHVGMIFDPSLDAPSFKSNSDFSNSITHLKQQRHRLTHYVTCIGSEHGYARFHTARYLEQFGLLPLSIIHPFSFIDPSSSVAIGAQVMPASVVHKFCSIGHSVILNTSCTVDHECVVGNGVHIMGGCSIAGRVTIGDYATLGTNATILPDVNIGEGALIGAGAVVTKSVPAHAVMLGVPAKQVRTIEPIFYETTMKELVGENG